MQVFKKDKFKLNKLELYQTKAFLAVYWENLRTHVRVDYDTAISYQMTAQLLHLFVQRSVKMEVNYDLKTTTISLSPIEMIFLRDLLKKDFGIPTPLEFYMNLDRKILPDNLISIK